jgi:selenocysteine lyase/cysteine desulfurase
MAPAPAALLSEPWIRAAYPVLDEVTYLNVGTYGLMPEPALAEYQALLAEAERRGGFGSGQAQRQAEAARSRLAALVGAQADEIAFTRNATDGINLVLAGLRWCPGDEVITSDQEHEAMIHPLAYLVRTQGLVVRRVGLSPEPDAMLQALGAVLTPRTRLVALSLVSCETGTRLPGRQVSQWAAEHGLLCLLDGAQASGAIAVDVRHLGCDFYASNGHKWLSGPKGTGFFYARRDRLTELAPAHVGAGSLQRVDLAAGVADACASGQRFEFGTRSWALFAGLGASLDWFERLAWPRVYAHVEALSDQLKQEIEARPWLHLLTPRAFWQSAGLVSFTVAGCPAGDVVSALRQRWSLYARFVPHYDAVRIATAHFNSPDDLQRLLTALECLHGEGAVATGAAAP